MRRTLALIAAAGLLLGAAPARAWHCDETTYRTYHATQADGRGWVAHRIELAQTDTVSFGAFTRYEGASRVMLGIWIVDASGAIVSDFILPHEEVKAARADLEPAPGTSVRIRQGNDGPVGISLGTSLGPGTYTAVIAVASDGRGMLELDACGEFDLVATTSGDEVASADESGFAGGRSIAVSGGGLARAFVASGVSRIERVRHRLFGAFFTWDDATISYDGPDGGDTGHNVYAFAGGAPGSYRFRIDEARGGPLGSTGLFVADVEMP